MLYAGYTFQGHVKKTTGELVARNEWTPEKEDASWTLKVFGRSLCIFEEGFLRPLSDPFR